MIDSQQMIDIQNQSSESSPKKNARRLVSKMTKQKSRNTEKMYQTSYSNIKGSSVDLGQYDSEPRLAKEKITNLHLRTNNNSNTIKNMSNDYIE